MTDNTSNELIDKTAAASEKDTYTTMYSLRLNTGFKQNSMCNHQYTGLIFTNTHLKFLKNLIIFSFLPSALSSLMSLSDIPACSS
jgi:hypothetical protein